MSGLTRKDWGEFEVNLSAFAVEGGILGGVRSLFTRPTLVVDPFTVAKVLQAGMSQSTQRDARGGLVLANYFVLVLEPDDFRELMALRVRLGTQIGPVLAERAKALKGELADQPAAKFKPDDTGTLARGRAYLSCAIRETGTLPSDSPGEVTVRFQPGAVAGASTVRVPAASVESPVAARLTWVGGSAPLHEGARVQFGRANPQAPSRFIALDGPGVDVVNRSHGWIEVRDGRVRVGRLGSNPLLAAGRPVQQGGEIELSDWPVQLVLGDAYLVRIDRA